MKFPCAGGRRRTFTVHKNDCNPAAAENLFNVSAQAYIDVPRGCCSTVAVQNTSTQAIQVQNSNLIAVREA